MPKLLLPPPPEPRISCVTQEKKEARTAPSGVGQSMDSMNAAIFQMAYSNPIETAQLVQTGLNQLNHISDTFALFYCKVAYVSALALSNDKRQWETFTAHDYWTQHEGHKPRVEIQDKCLKWMMIFVFMAECKKAKDTARMYTGALQDAFDEKMDVSELDEYLKIGGGVDTLSRKRSKREKREKINTSQKQESQKACVESLTQGECYEGDQKLTPTRRIPLRDFIEQAKAIFRRGNNPILLEVTPNQLVVFSNKTAGGGTANLKITAPAQASMFFEAQCLKVDAVGS